MTPAVEVLYRDKLVYLPVPKNASTMFVNTFRNAGWDAIDINELPDDMVYFSHIQDPHVRHTKGVVEFLSRHGLLDIIDIERFALLLTHGMYDVHTYPISMLYPNHHRITHWIPLDLERNGFNANILTSYFLEKNGIRLKIPKSTIIHASTSKQKDFFKKLSEVKLRYPDWIDELSFRFLSEDILSYSTAIEYYNTLRK